MNPIPSGGVGSVSATSLTEPDADAANMMTPQEILEQYPFASARGYKATLELLSNFSFDRFVDAGHTEDEIRSVYAALNAMLLRDLEDGTLDKYLIARIEFLFDPRLARVDSREELDKVSFDSPQ